MTISYKEAIKAKDGLEEKILDDPNVVSIGVVEERDNLGQSTGDFAVQVGVNSLDVYKQSLTRGDSIIPHEYLLKSDDGTQTEKHVHVTVIKQGKIEALLSNDIPSAIDNLNFKGSSTGLTTRLRPSPCGVGVGHSTVSAGTFGLLRNYTKGTNVGKSFILSNNHVLGNSNSENIGDTVLFAGSESATFHNPLRKVLESLSKSHTLSYPSRKTHTFEQDFPLRIIRRPYSAHTYAAGMKTPTVDASKAKSMVGLLLFGLGLCATTRRPNRLLLAVSNQLLGVAEKSNTKYGRIMPNSLFFNSRRVINPRVVSNDASVAYCKK